MVVGLAGDIHLHVHIAAGFDVHMLVGKVGTWKLPAEIHSLFEP